MEHLSEAYKQLLLKLRLSWPHGPVLSCDEHSIKIALFELQILHSLFYSAGVEL